MIRRPPRSTRTDTLFPYTTLFRSATRSLRRIWSARISCSREDSANVSFGRPPPEKTSVLRSEEHTSELQSLMRISYAVFCLKKKILKKKDHSTHARHNRTDTVTHHVHITTLYKSHDDLPQQQ